MAFKMKGSPMYRNYGIGTPSKKQSMHKMPDGTMMADSAMKKHTKEHGDILPGRPKKTKEELIKEGFTPADADRMIKDGATTGRTVEKMPELEKAEPAPKPKQTSQIIPKKSTVSAHGQLNDAELEYQEDLKRSKQSPNKQKEVGGTKNKKGNIFTKRGRTQRSINKVEKTKDKLRDNANKEGFDTKKSKKLMKKVTKKTVKRDNKIHKYLSKEDRKNNPDQYKGVKFAGDDGMDKN